MEITKKQEEILKNIYKRLYGYPINLDDREDNNLKVGSIVKVYYNEDEPDKCIVGIIKYNLQYDKYYVRMNKAVDYFNNGNRIYYLNYIDGCYSKVFLLEKIRDTGDDIYQHCMNLHEQKHYREISQELLSLYSDDKISLTKEEFLELYEIKENEEYQDTEKLSPEDVIPREVFLEIQNMIKEVLMNILNNEKYKENY